MRSFFFFKEIVMATKKFVVTGDQYRVIDRRMREIKRQLDQDDGSPLDPEWVASELQKVVEGQGLFPTGFKIFETIKLGTVKTPIDLYHALVTSGCRVTDSAKDMFGDPQFTVATQETEVVLVAVSVAKLGFKRGATREDIYKRAQELGLELCSAEVGPQLRLQYKDQPECEWLYIAMNPTIGLCGLLRVFSVCRNADGRWLDCCRYGRPDGTWDADHRWIFLLPK